MFSLVSEAVVAVVLTVRFAVGYEQPWGEAVYHGVFHAISAFNNAGFSVHSDSLMRCVVDPWVSLTIAAAVIIGGLGFPVVSELAKGWRRPSRWSVLTRITVTLTVALLVAGTVVTTLAEASNPGTLGPLSGPGKLLAGFFHSTVTRTAGFDSVDISAMYPESLFTSDLLMFIGGGTTQLPEVMRGRRLRDTHLGHRRRGDRAVPPAAVTRQRAGLRPVHRRLRRPS